MFSRQSPGRDAASRCVKKLEKSGEKTRRRDEGGGKYNPVFVAVNVVSVWRPGFPELRLFVVYIARAPSNYCADATPTRGVWSRIQSLRRDLSRLCGLPDRSTPTRREGETSHLSLQHHSELHTLSAQHTDM